LNEIIQLLCIKVLYPTVENELSFVGPNLIKIQLFILLSFYYRMKI